MLARPALVERHFALLSAAVVVVCGTLVVVQPLGALAVVGAVALVALTRIPPVPHLVVLLALTAIVPYGVQNQLGIGGGSGSPGLLLSDVLLLSGLLRAIPALLDLRLDRKTGLACLLIGGFVALAGLQLLHGLAAGRNPSTVGAEFRVLFGFASFLLAVPILRDEAQRNRLLRTLPGLALAVGLWGIAQWMFSFEFTEAADAGVQEGIRFTTSGRGQLQGGLFAFPVAAVGALAGLMSHEIRSVRVRLALVAALVLNLVCLLLTYERTFWVATALTCAFVMVKAGGTQRFRAMVAGVGVTMIAFAAMATLAPGELTAARERLLSLSQYGSDNSVRYRVAESGHVLDEIVKNPVVGSGLGATIFFGRPWDRVPPESLTFAHNGYLWLAWKVGIPGALMLWGVLFSSIGWLKRPPDGSALEAVRTGCRGGLLTLAIGSVTFPSFNQLSITAVMGVLMAIALASGRTEETAPAEALSTTAA